MMNDNSLPKRKDNRLKGFDYSSCGTFFLTICVKDSEITLVIS